MKTINIQISKQPASFNNLYLKPLERKGTLRKLTSNQNSHSFIRDAKRSQKKSRSPANSTQSPPMFPQKNEVRELRGFERQGLYSFHQMKLGNKRDITVNLLLNSQVVNITRENINKIDFKKVLDSLYVTEPFFDGMPKINFNDNPSYDPNKPRTQFWNNISKQLLGFYAPKDGALLLPKEKIKDDHLIFKKSKVLNHIRKRSELDSFRVKKEEGNVRKKESQTSLQSQQVIRKLTKIRSSTIHNSQNRLRLQIPKKLPQFSFTKSNNIAFSPQQEAEIERGIALLEETKFKKKNILNKSMAPKENFKYNVTVDELQMGIALQRLRRKSCYCRFCSTKQFIYRAEIFEYVEHSDSEQSEGSFLSTDRGQKMNSERNQVPFKSLFSKINNADIPNDDDDSPMILRKKFTSYLNNPTKQLSKQGSSEKGPLYFDIEQLRSNQISEITDENEDTKPKVNMHTLKKLIAKHSPRKTPMNILLRTPVGNKDKETPSGLSPCIKQNLDFQTQKHNKRTQSYTDLLIKPQLNIPPALQQRLLQINQEDKLVKKKFKPRISMKALNEYNKAFVRFTSNNKTQGLNTVVNSPRISAKSRDNSETFRVNYQRVYSSSSLNRPLSTVSSMKLMNRLSNSKLVSIKENGKTPKYFKLNSNRFSVQMTPNDLSTVGEIKPLIEKFEMSKDNQEQAKTQSQTKTYFPSKKSSLPVISTHLGDVRIICHKRNHLQKMTKMKKHCDKIQKH